MRASLAAIAALLFFVQGFVMAAQPRGAESRDMALTGFHDLQGRGATSR